MTAPISSFSKLSLTHTPMQSSRGQGRRQSSGSGERPPPPDDGSSRTEHDDEEIHLVDRIFALDHCRPHGMSEDGHPSSPRYAFQIAEAQVKRYGVRISAANPRSAICSCSEAGTCRHGRWLLKQLDRAGLQVRGGGDSNLFQSIGQKGLEKVCQDLRWELRGGSSDSGDASSDSEEPEEPEEQKWELKKKLPASQLHRQTRGLLKERCDTVRDIMATLCSEPTEDYRPDIFEAADDITERDIAVPGDVGGTFSKWLLQYEDVLVKFKPLVSHDMRASAYFQNMTMKAYKSCELMDRYAQIGPSPGEIHHDVVWCAQSLVEIVKSVSKNISKRQPLNPLSREEASKTLVTILGEVVDRNKDVYQDDRLPRRRPHGEPQSNRNLYQRLIGSISPSNPAGPMFILRDLQDLPEAQPFVESLEETLGKLQTIGWGPAPQAYRDKLSTIIARLKGSPGPSTTTAEKRRASLMDRKNKRMK
jgi:hypothetical protein